MKSPSLLEDLAITYALLMGGDPQYDDYGHPERAQARQYWSIRPDGGPEAYGYTRAQCARNWLWKKGYHLTTDGQLVSRPIPWR